MEKKQKLKINRDMLRQLRDSEMGKVDGGAGTGASCCTAAGVLTACQSIGNTSCCTPKNWI